MDKAERNKKMNCFDIAPFALPNAPAGALKFEESRDIETVEVKE